MKDKTISSFYNTFPSTKYRRWKTRYLVSKSTRFISLTLPDISARTSMIIARICSGNSLSGVISEYHKSTTKSFKILSMNSLIAASTTGESIFLFHFAGGGKLVRRESFKDNCFFSK
ncbi:hypothetical protein VIGAN_01285500 [Vigna angularis var. angularis]|uniref:Uncharacterized protein n=1 Tax=Vigna angularis var. angularis TaxID=157739 RepID=A0A0S3R3F0_PHAAN|nr:hypothetical protein VIGAN_01285500 [Vigna angularis var. angularis]